MGYVRIRDGILDATHANRLQEAIVSGLRDRLGLQDSFGIDPPEPLPVLKIPTCPLTTLEICRIYVFADKYMMPVLKCSATDALCHALSSSQSRTHALDIIKFVGDNTPDPCGLRNVCIDFYTEDLLPQLVAADQGTQGPTSTPRSCTKFAFDYMISGILNNRQISLKKQRPLWIKIFANITTIATSTMRKLQRVFSAHARLLT